MSEPLQTEVLKLALKFVKENHYGGPDAFKLIADIEKALMTFQGGAQQSKEQREWVGLTHEDIDKAIEDNQRFGGFRKVGFAYDLELLLKEKNTWSQTKRLNSLSLKELENMIVLETGVSW